MFEYLVESHTPFNGNTQWVVKSPDLYKVGQTVTISPTQGTSISGTILRIITEGPLGGGGTGTGGKKKETEEEKEEQRKKESGEGWYWNK